MECISALIITSIVIVLMSLAMTSVRSLAKHSLSQDLDWQIFLKEMESDTHDFVLERVFTNDIELYEKTTKKHVTLKTRGRMYLSYAGGGYVPVFGYVNVTYCRRLDDRRVYIETERENGEKLSGILCFDTR
ncbi:MAG: competence type IV pilus minor pilin ComGF [Limosilactobacillus sp.]|nr:competence type IV pilus minor pilin ComGF [Limosilactobacillus sp.]